MEEEEPLLRELACRTAEAQRHFILDAGFMAG